MPSCLTSCCRLLVLLAVACGDDGPGSAEELALDAADQAMAEVDAEAAEEAKKAADELAAEIEANRPLIDQAGGHADGPLTQRRGLFFGLKPLKETRYLPDGRSLTAFTIDRKGVPFKVGDGRFETGRWWFCQDNLLRLHTLVGRNMSGSMCAAAAAKLTEDYGAPLKDEDRQKIWVGDTVMAKWTDKTRAEASPRCEIEWLDLGYMRR
jgi:hypothetical protein